MMISLPVEILHRIFEHCETPIPFQDWEQGYSKWEPQHPRPRDLIALSKVCHRFRSVAHPLIYRTLAFRSEWRAKDEFLDTFTHALCADPLVGNNIRGLRVDSWVSNFDVDYFAKKLGASPKHLDERQKRWLKRWVEAESGNVALVLLLLAPRLRILDYTDILSSIRGIAAYLSGRQDVEDDHLAMALNGKGDIDDDNVADDTGPETASEDGDGNNESGDVPVGQLLGPVSGNPMTLLREVRLRHGRYLLKRVRFIEGVLLNPGLEILRLFAFRWTKEEVRAMKWNNAVSNITTLQLKNCLIDARGLANALRRCRLRHLHIVLAPVIRMLADADGDGVNFDEMGVVFRRYGQSLESLDFETIAFREYYVVDGHIGPLSALSRLRSLKISVEELGEFNEEDEDELKMGLRTSLPPTLESIHIRPSHSKATRVALTLLMDEAHSALRTVEVEVDDENRNEDDPQDLVVPGWSKSFRTDMISRDDTELVDFYSCRIVVFSRDAEAH
ncbi:unnamed protein product [Clonostachys solani]|uniref:F-box domain-containing protein n=1 Tax=Clonostachys solani TaxID=160281 RepID=A0A9N9Z979_9HYPO|nr:unnamed protein product [Clonostachys solani]